MQIVHQQKGVYWLDVAAFGQAAHGSRPWKGKNAIELAMRWYNDVKELFENSINGDWQTTVNLGSLHAGEEFNKVPGTASLKLDIRYTKDLKPEQMLAEMIAVDGLEIQTVADITNNFEINDSGVSAEVVGQSLDPADRPDILIRIHDDTPSMFTNPNQKQVQALREAVETTTSQRAILERETGASDMAFFSGNNIPCVVVGPKGRELQDSGEHLDIESLRPFYDTMREFITTDRTE
jgi:succinyl-diaminopimelate desuccinylase